MSINSRNKHFWKQLPYNYKYLGSKKPETAVNTLLKKTSQLDIGNHGDKVRKSGGSKRSLVPDDVRMEPVKKKGKMSKTKKEFIV